MIPHLFTGIYYHPITIRVDYMGELPALCAELGDLLKMLPPLLSPSHGYAATGGAGGGEGRAWYQYLDGGLRLARS